ncbi:hypothetical protein R3P38DRAFT_3243591 [Favolaschia claudopus]|uniref:Uncharacterized protein n=1 Tax=Favolaschia claudopus TaxID=2862362 RepID=A0AAV9Z357_9AGAR
MPSPPASTCLQVVEVKATAFIGRRYTFELTTSRSACSIFKRLCNAGDDGRPEEEWEVATKRRQSPPPPSLSPAGVGWRSTIAESLPCSRSFIPPRIVTALHVDPACVHVYLGSGSQELETRYGDFFGLRFLDRIIDFRTSSCAVFLPAPFPPTGPLRACAAGMFVDMARIRIESILVVSASAAARTTVTAALVPITLWRRPLRSSPPALLSLSRDLPLPIRPSVYR